MVRLLWILLITFGLVTACTEFEVEEQNLPDVSAIDALSIPTAHPVVDIHVAESAFDSIYTFYLDKILVDATIDYYDENRTLILTGEPAQIEIKGTSSANLPLKSIGIIFNDSINNGLLRIVNPEKLSSSTHQLQELKTVRLRNSGNDFKDNMIKDLSYTQLAIEVDIDLDLMYGHPVQVFVNGDYYGLMNLRTESNAAGISRLYGVQSKDVTILKVDGNDLDFDEGDENFAQELIEAVEDMDGPKLMEIIDVDNFIDYIVFQDYIGNRDWPDNNAKFFSINGGKYRCFLFDLDFAAFNNKKPQIPSFEYRDEPIALIYEALRQESGFQQLFDQRQKAIYSKLSPALFNSIMTEFSARIEADMPYQISRWGEPSSIFRWKMNLGRMRRDFESRDKYIRRKYDL